MACIPVQLIIGAASLFQNILVHFDLICGIGNIERADIIAYEFSNYPTKATFQNVRKLIEADIPEQVKYPPFFGLVYIARKRGEPVLDTSF